MPNLLFCCLATTAGYAWCPPFYAAAWVVVAMVRCLSRDPYGAQSDRLCGGVSFDLQVRRIRACRNSLERRDSMRSGCGKVTARMTKDLYREAYRFPRMETGLLGCRRCQLSVVAL